MQWPASTPLHQEVLLTQATSPILLRHLNDHFMDRHSGNRAPIRPRGFTDADSNPVEKRMEHGCAQAGAIHRPATRIVIDTGLTAYGVRSLTHTLA